MSSLSTMLEADQVAPELCAVIASISCVSMRIAQSVRRGALADMLGTSDSENVQGEVQKKLDLIANEYFKQALLENEQVYALASEEEVNVVAGCKTGRYSVAFDPLDGSSNIDVNGQIGTIFTIYPARPEYPCDSELQFQQTGEQQVCAGYVLYGAACLLVMSTGGAVRCFTLDPLSGEFELTIPALSIPTETQEFAVNMAYQRFWATPFKRYVDDLLAGESGLRAKRFTMRWNAAMVGDVHRILMRGGIFCYPSNSRNLQQPAKLRLLYEANPMAFLVERAGGKAYTESERILTIKPSALHQRVAVILGSTKEVETCLQYLPS